MQLFDALDIADIQEVVKEAGANVKLFPDATDSELYGGTDGQIPSYDTDGGIEVNGFFQPAKTGLENLTNALMGNSLGEPVKPAQTFLFLASQINFHPTPKTRLVEKDGTNWVVMTKAVDSQIQDSQLFWNLSLREPR